MHLIKQNLSFLLWVELLIGVNNRNNRNNGDDDNDN